MVQVISVIAEQLVDGASLVGSVRSWALFRVTIDLVSGSGFWIRNLVEAAAKPLYYGQITDT